MNVKWSVLVEDLCGYQILHQSQFTHKVHQHKEKVSEKLMFKWLQQLYNISKLVWKNADSIAEKSFSVVLEQLQASPAHKIVVCADGSWQHRGWNSTQGSYVVLNSETNQVLIVITLQKERSSHLSSSANESVVLDENIEETNDKEY